MTPSVAIYLFSFLSGTAALIYELLWSRWLELMLGSSMQAVSIILATFMAGLAIGGRWGGSFIDRRRNPLLIYGIIELFIGVFAFAMPSLLEAVASLPQFWSGGGAALLYQRLFVACSVLIIPATLMGATFPVLTRLIVTTHANIGSTIARLYFSNLAGAVVGVLLSGFVLIETLGLKETSYIAVATNFGIAIAALILVRSASFVKHPSIVSRHTALAMSQRDTRALLSALFISGLAAMAYEVFWTRILVFQIGSTIYAFSLILAIFLCALATGSLTARVMVIRGWGFAAFAVTQAFMGFGALAGLYVAGYAPWVEYMLLPRTSGWGEMVLVHSLIALPVVAPAAFFSGMIIPLAASLMVREDTAGLAMGRIYLANTSGAFFGPLLAGFMLIPLIGIQWGIVLIATIQITVTVLLLRPGKRRPIAAALVGLVALLFLSVSSGGQLRSTVAMLNEALYEPLFYREGQSGTVSVFRDTNDGSRLLDINGFVAAGTGKGYAYMQMMGHLPALLHNDPHEALVIGFGTGATAASLLEYPIEGVTVAEIDPAVIEAAPYSRAGNLALLDDPRLHLFIEDGRNLLTRLPRQYDLIVLEPMPPYFAKVVNLYTKEFYALAADRLNTGGILCQWLPLHLLSPEMLTMVLHSFLLAFDDVLVWQEPKSNIAMMLGVNGSFSLNLGQLGRGMARPKVAADLAGAGVLSAADLINHFVMNRALAEQFTAGAPFVSDNHPLLEFAGVRAMRYGVATRYGRENAERLRLCGTALQPQLEKGGGIEMILRSGKATACASELKE